MIHLLNNVVKKLKILSLRDTYTPTVHQESLTLTEENASANLKEEFS